MQTAKITMGGEYATMIGGRLVGFRVTEIHTSRKLDGTSTVIAGVAIDEKDPQGKAMTLRLTPEDIKGELTQFKELLAEKKRKQDEENAKVRARIDHRNRAIRLLAKAIGVHPLIDARYGSEEYRKYKGGKDDLPHIEENGMGLKIVEETLSHLIAYLELQGVTLNDEAAAE
jgi:hypothetical protein